MQKKIIYLILAFSLGLAGYFSDDISSLVSNNSQEKTVSYSSDNIPSYNGEDYVILDNNNPDFKESDYTTKTFENYSDLDSLGRCGVAYANISKETMPTEKRGSIGMIKPSGWHTIKYSFVDGKYLYNRCHLIAYMLAGENANPKNLITCTRNMNASVMLKFENEVADYVKETGHHVLYRVTPVFKENDLLARGVKMEAASVEDDRLRFNVFVFNVQDGVSIDYATGDSHLK